ncbi:hypothetical protein SAMN05518801_102405 [Novosphingobium sp. CF614]|uniref:phasin family protein n=1 Tax=Novosphingobium sp. CF614 TaxID=1884364 RepID=UPI0008ED1A60|nr:phasin family protein [Novosphingobium sp. CF614]SFF88030.1 hypothetical protein SAMN05518801_102405 [Novosphingobium sp. CF614]
MAANEDPKDIDSADKAYKAAAEAVPVKSPAPAAKAETGKAETGKVVPAKAKPLKPLKPLKRSEAVEPKPAAAKIAALAPRIKPGPKIKPVAKSTPVVQAKPRPIEKVVPAKATGAEPAAKVAKGTEEAAIAVASPKAATSKAAETAFTKTPAFAGLFTNFMLEEKTMDMSANFSGFQDAMTEAQAKAKAAFEKSTVMLGEAGDFTKGNVEAIMESGKILAEGVQSIGSEIVAESRSAFETMTGDIKELAAAKSPTDFFKVQGEMMRKNFDSAVAYGSKNSETMLKLMSDVMAPISGRVSMAMEKVRSTSL